MSGEFKSLLTDLLTYLPTITGLVPSPVPFNPSSMPSSLANAGNKVAFCVDIQSRDAGDRQGSLMRVDHTVTISMLIAYKQQGWSTSLGQALDMEQSIIACLLDRDFFGDYDVRWLGSARVLNDSHEYFIHAMTFSMEITHSTGST
jgi:hypothetical protein